MVSDRKPVGVIRDLHKQFGPIEVLKGIDFDIYPGEIHALLGANGAGKSTFLCCLSGAIQPTSGQIEINGNKYEGLSPRESLSKGIGIIYQHFQLIQGLTVADNIFLGAELGWSLYVDEAEQNRQAKEILNRLGVDIDPSTMLEKLSIGERQAVEIARVLRAGPKILILDEPTAALSEKEINALHDVVRKLAHEQNLAVIYVTHLLNEIELIGDKVTILRDGKIVWTKDVKDVNESIIAQTIAPPKELAHKERQKYLDREFSLKLTDFSTDFISPLNLEVKSGEILGIYGLMGSGRTELLESLFGARPHLGGEVLLDGKEVDISAPYAALNSGFALVPADRNDQSLFGSLSALENNLIPHFGGIAKSIKNRKELYKYIVEKLNVKPYFPDLEAKRFSGGNAQKIVLGRWLLPNLKVKVLMLDEPTQGVDIGARLELYQALFEYAEEGGIVIFASSDPTEVCELADRVLIMRSGVVSGELTSEITEEDLVQMAHIGSFATDIEEAVNA